jgi:hypothetical protein
MWKPDETTKQVSNENYPIFGLNQHAKLTKFTYNPNGGKDKSPKDSIDIEVSVGKFFFRHRIWEITRDTKQKTIAQQEERQNQLISHYLYCIFTNDEIQEMYKKKLSACENFKAFASVLTEEINKKGLDIDIDVFLQYQAVAQKGRDRTFLELPKTTVFGQFITRAYDGVFTPVQTNDSLSYVRASDGLHHPFKRDTYFLNSSISRRTDLPTAHPKKYADKPVHEEPEEPLFEETNPDLPF